MAFVMTRHEKRVEQHCQIRGIESFLPLYRIERRWKDGSKPVLQLPLFPGYIFVRIGGHERVPVLKMPSVLSIVSCMGKPLPVADSYIYFLRESVREGKIQPHPCVTTGMRIRIKSGVMAGMEGMLLRKQNKYRAVLTLDMIMKSVTVEVELENIEPLSRSANSHLSYVAACP